MKRTTNGPSSFGAPLVAEDAVPDGVGALVRDARVVALRRTDVPEGEGSLKAGRNRGD